MAPVQKTSKTVATTSRPEVTGAIEMMQQMMAHFYQRGFCQPPAPLLQFNGSPREKSAACSSSSGLLQLDAPQDGGRCVPQTSSRTLALELPAPAAAATADASIEEPRIGKVGGDNDLVDLEDDCKKALETRAAKKASDAEGAKSEKKVLKRPASRAHCEAVVCGERKRKVTPPTSGEPVHYRGGAIYCDTTKNRLRVYRSTKHRIEKSISLLRNDADTAWALAGQAIDKFVEGRED